MTTTNDAGRISYSTDGSGRWRKRTWAKQCPERAGLTGRCQGVAGHEGDHWCFGESGSYCYSHPDGGCGFIPPDHKHYHYKTPLEMAPHCHVAHHVDEEVSDPDLVARLERGELVGGASVTRPCSEEEWERLKAERRAT